MRYGPGIHRRGSEQESFIQIFVDLRAKCFGSFVSILSKPHRIAAYLWAAPVTLPAMGLAFLARVTGSRVGWHTGVLEASDGLLPLVLSRIYPPMSIAAITLGHVVLAQCSEDLQRTRSHERVHVRQYERWGGFFPLMYLGESLWEFLRGRDPYRDNRFEVAARGGAGRSG